MIDLKQGDVFLKTQRRCSNQAIPKAERTEADYFMESFTGIVTSADMQENGVLCISYQPYRVEGQPYLSFGHGVAFIKPQTSTDMYTLIKHVAPRKTSHWYPKLGDRGYDLMC